MYVQLSRLCLTLSDQSGLCASGLYQSKLNQKLLHVGILNKLCICANGQLCTTVFQLDYAKKIMNITKLLNLPAWHASLSSMYLDKYLKKTHQHESRTYCISILISKASYLNNLLALLN